MATIASVVTQLIAKSEQFKNPVADSTATFTRFESTVVNGMKRTIETWGWSERAVEAYRLAEKGATAETLRHVQALDAQINRLERQQSMMVRGGQIWEQTRTPIEQYNGKIAELRALLTNGAISQDTYARAAAQAAEAQKTATAAMTAGVQAAGGLSATLGSLAAKFVTIGVMDGMLNSLANSIEEAHRRGQEMDFTFAGVAKSLYDMAARIPVAGEALRIFTGLFQTLSGEVERTAVLLDQIEMTKILTDRTKQAADSLKTLAAMREEVNLQIELRNAVDDYARAHIRAREEAEAFHAKVAQLLEAARLVLPADEFAAMKAFYEDMAILNERNLHIEIERQRTAEITAAAKQRQLEIERAAEAERMRALAEDARQKAAIMEEGKRIWEQTRTAAERYEETIKRLKELLEAGAIDQETYRRAVEQAQQALDRANEAADKSNRLRSAADQMQSPAAIERRFVSAFPTGQSKQELPGLQLAKKTDQLIVDGKTRGRSLQAIEGHLRRIADNQPAVFGSAN